jgi:ubiquinone/menaquinone biosynthesis C-methylase UbiE
MNRKLRRANHRRDKRPAATELGSKVDPKFIEAFLEQGLALLSEGRDEEATELAIRIVRLQETEETRAFFVECVKRWKLFPDADRIRDVVARSWREAWAKPQELFSLTKEILKADSVIGPAIQRAMAAWPRRLSLNELLGPTGLAQISTDSLLPAVLERGSLFDLELECFLTSLRAALLEVVMQGRCGDQNKNIIELCCALGRQCFINEYVFDLTRDENDRANQLRDKIARALGLNYAIAPMEIALLSAYMQLDCLPKEALLKRSWLKSIVGLLEEQIQVPEAERKLRSLIPQITPISDDTSIRVAKQYEENPFPRWVKLPPNRPMPDIDKWMPQYFPVSNFRKIGKGSDVDVLIAGCGTGQHSIIFAQSFPGARILAVDLSMTSLCYAKQKTQAMGIDNIEYAQADILELGLDKRFDIISSSGVLHHLADPEKGWRTLLRLLQPDGCMHVGLYSERAHRNLIFAQRWLSERGFTPSVESIRRARQELINAAATNASLGDVLTFVDFYSTSEFRDLFLPTQMHRYTIPKVQTFLDENNLEFLGFSIRSEIRDQFRMRFSGQAEVDLRLWDKFETEHPNTFKGMYEFWVQKKRP